LIRTFIDAGVLIAAACGVPEIAERALRVLDDPDRAFVTNDLVRLEVLPKPSFHGNHDQVEFYEEFFANARAVPISKRLLEEALREGCQFGLSACDAVHVAAARRGRCAEFVTTERASKPIFRVPGLRFTSLQQAKAS
jgi:predicted nucleic acid-binding protein